MHSLIFSALLLIQALTEMKRIGGLVCLNLERKKKAGGSVNLKKKNLKPEIRRSRPPIKNKLRRNVNAKSSC